MGKNKKNILYKSKQYIIRLGSPIKKRRKRIFSSLGLSLLILTFSYIFSNSYYSITGESTILKYISITQDFLGINKYNNKEDLDKFTFINVGFDKQLVDSIKIDEEFVGNKAITDRKKLYLFLKQIKNTKYNYIVVDVDLTTKYKTDYNDSLYHLIAQMPRIAIASDYYDRKNIDKRVRNKSFWVFYNTTIFNTDLFKIPLIYNDTSSIAYKVYFDIEKKKNSSFKGIQKIGFAYFDGWSLSKKTIYPKMYIRDTHALNEQAYESVMDAPDNIYSHLGSDVLDYYFSSDQLKKEYAKRLFDNKIILIGSFEDKDDSHLSYRGAISGTLVIANTILSLQNKLHHFSLWSILFLFLFFCYISYNILFGTNANFEISDMLFNHTITKKFMPFAFIWTYYTLVISIICGLLFIIFSEVHDILFTSTFLTFINVVVSIFRDFFSNKN